MNERIKLLADEAAKFSAIMALPTGESGDNLFVEKFAELIVQECVSTLNDMHLWQSVNNQNYPNSWHDAVDQGIDAIKSYFGG